MARESLPGKSQQLPAAPRSGLVTPGSSGLLAVAVAGLGWWGPKLVRNFKIHPGVGEVVGVDARPEVCRKARDEFDVAVEADLGGILRSGRVQAVVVATPPQTHFEIAKEALLAGCHVLLTKPPTKTTEQLAELIQLADRQHLVLMTDSTFVYSSHLAKVKELLDGCLVPEIGFVQSIRFGNDMHMHHIERIRNTMFANGLDVVEDLFFHDAAILTYLFGGNLTPISIQRYHALHPDLCDTAFIHLRTDSSAVHVGLSWTLPERRRELLVYGSRSYLKLDDLAEEPRITLYELESKQVTAFAVNAREPLYNVVDHFLDCIATGARPITDGAYMLSLMRTVEAVRSK